MSSTTPPPDAGGPEFLDSSDGQVVGPSSDGPRGGGRRTALIAGGAALGLALVGGGVWAATSFLATGAQPAEGLPASTVGYASVDLDPSGSQKIEAFRMIQKFPALEKELDGLDAEDDLLEKVFSGLEDECEDVDYADDVEPWLGQRFAAAAVDLAEDGPTPVAVVQVTDAGAAEDGLALLQECAGSDVGGWSVDGDWAVIAESTELAEQVTAATAEGSLADDETFQRWTGEAGDAGVVTLYAAPGAGQLLAELEDGGSPFGGFGMFPGGPMPERLDGPGGAEAGPGGSPESQELAEALEGFGGAAATLRFADAGLELEAAGTFSNEVVDAFTGTGAGDVVATLPDDTAATYALSLPEGWFDSLLDGIAAASGGEVTAEDLRSEVESELGVSAEDLDALGGGAAALAVGSDFDPATLFASADGSDVPIGAKVVGDADAVERLLDAVREQAGPDGAFLGHDSEGDVVGVGPSEDYRAALLDEGGLGDTEVFGNVLPDTENASGIFFVDFEAGDWLTSIAGGDRAVEENLEPLQGLGLSVGTEDDTSHAVLRLTTD